jgi:hypothetical protein
MRGNVQARLLLGAAAVLVLVAVPVAVASAAGESGNPQASASGLKKKVRNLRHRLTVVEDQLTEFIDGPFPPSGPAGGDLIGSFPSPLIGGNAVGPLEIQNPNRSVNLPIGGFVNWSDNAAIEYQTGGTDDAPDFIGDADAALYVIEWDAGPGADESDTDYATTTFTVPPDHASGGQFALRVSKEPPLSAVAERLRCTVAINGDFVATEIPGGSAGFASRVTTTAANASYMLTPPGTYDPGDTVQVLCAVDDGAPVGKTYDDTTYLHSIEFRYTSIQ